MKKTSSSGSAGESRRVAKVEAEVQKIVAQSLLNFNHLQEGGILTVTRVQMPADLRSAKVYISAFNSKTSMKVILQNLQERALEVQDQINHKLHMRYCPKLTFFEDQSLEKVLKIESLLKDIKVKSESEDKENHKIENEDE